MTARAAALAKPEEISVGSQKITITHPDRILFPDDGITKGDLCHYYRDVAHWLLPYLVDRPLTLQRWPTGLGGFTFFEKSVPKGTPDWIQTSRQPRADGKGEVEYALCHDARSLLHFANLASITFHVWMSRLPDIESPSFLLFDLDPFEGCTVRTLARVALAVRAEMAARSLTPLVKTTGGKGLHVVVPLAKGHSSDQARGVSEVVARTVHTQLPDAVTLERTKAKRARGTVYFDWAQLGLGRTLVPPYVVRGRAGAPVSMPLAWEEVEALEGQRTTRPTEDVFRKWNLTNVPALLAAHDDPWKGAFSRGQKLKRAQR